MLDGGPGGEVVWRYFKGRRGLLKNPKNMVDRLKKYLRETRTELKKVSWPTREETVRSTIVVIIASAAFAVFLGGLDFIFQSVLNRFVL
jgi:preprotein translocase subunit SecE